MGIPKPLRCSLCNEIESVTHLFFDCTVSKLLWNDVHKIFDIMIIDYLGVASKWLCETRYMQFIMVSSVVFWSIWNKMNFIVFNRNTWLNMNHVWHPTLAYLRDCKVPFKDQEWVLVDQFKHLLIRKLRMPMELELD
jgi:hypothetical protein